MRLFLILFMVLISNPVAASQPISTSLADCAAIYINIGLIAEDRGNAERHKKAEEWTKDFYILGYEQSDSEGIKHPEDHFDALVKERLNKWISQFSNPLKLQDTKDWIDYCKSLGESSGMTF